MYRNGVNKKVVVDKLIDWAYVFGDLAFEQMLEAKISMPKKIFLILLFFGSFLRAGTAYGQNKSLEEARVYIISPKNGETVTNPITILFGLKGMGIAPAGVQKDNTGHHHLLLDVANLPDMDQPIPADEQHKHFGGGQSETTLMLPAGKHTLQLLFGDFSHIPHHPPVFSEKIIISVE